MSAGRSAIPAPPPEVRFVRELPTGEFPLHQQPEWSAAFAWLAQGTTGRGTDGLDMGLFGQVRTGIAQGRWRRLRQVTGVAAAVHARQVHGALIGWHDRLPGGLTILDELDGHATATPGILLTVSVADCVPVFLVSAQPRAVALLHAGWRGVAGGILEAGIQLLGRRVGAAAAELYLHCGPAVCGECYEVGPEVPVALHLASAGPSHSRLDLRAAIAHRAVNSGVSGSRITISGHCTLCGEESFWSHRGGSRERQLGVLGIRG